VRGSVKPLPAVAASYNPLQYITIHFAFTALADAWPSPTLRMLEPSVVRKLAASSLGVVLGMFPVDDLLFDFFATQRYGVGFDLQMRQHEFGE